MVVSEPLLLESQPAGDAEQVELAQALWRMRFLSPRARSLLQRALFTATVAMCVLEASLYMRSGGGLSDEPVPKAQVFHDDAAAMNASETLTDWETIDIVVAALVGASCGFALGVLVMLLPCLRLRRWPNSYIGDATFHTGDSPDRFYWKRCMSRFRTFLLVLWYRPPPDVEDEDWQSCLGMDGQDSIPPQVVSGVTGLQTVPSWKDQTCAPGLSAGPRWSPGTGQGLLMRAGPNYKKNGFKQESGGYMYECISLDIIKADQMIERIFGSVMEVPPCHQVGNGALTWTPSCSLPRVICINAQLPYFATNPLSRPDPGCSVVALFHITSDTLQTLESPHQPPAMKLFQEFWARDGGNLRAVKQANSFKAIAFCENFEEVAGNWMPTYARKKNGTPVLITKSGNMYKDANAEWLEVSVDVRLFATAARIALSQWRDHVARASIHIGFLIQGSKDEELPEGLIGDVVVHHLHIEKHARHVTLPAVAPSSSFLG